MFTWRRDASGWLGTERGFDRSAEIGRATRAKRRTSKNIIFLGMSVSEQAADGGSLAAWLCLVRLLRCIHL